MLNNVFPAANCNVKPSSQALQCATLNILLLNFMNFKVLLMLTENIMLIINGRDKTRPL